MLKIYYLLKITTNFIFQNYRLIFVKTYHQTISHAYKSIKFIKIYLIFIIARKQATKHQIIRYYFFVINIDYQVCNKVQYNLFLCDLHYKFQRFLYFTQQILIKILNPILRVSNQSSNKMEDSKIEKISTFEQYVGAVQQASVIVNADVETCIKFSSDNKDAKKYTNAWLNYYENSFVNKQSFKEHVKKQKALKSKLDQLFVKQQKQSKAYSDSENKLNEILTVVKENKKRLEQNKSETFKLKIYPGEQGSYNNLVNFIQQMLKSNNQINQKVQQCLDYVIQSAKEGPQIFQKQQTQTSQIKAECKTPNQQQSALQLLNYFQTENKKLFQLNNQLGSILTPLLNSKQQYGFVNGEYTYKIMIKQTSLKQLQQKLKSIQSLNKQNDSFIAYLSQNIKKIMHQNDPLKTTQVQIPNQIDLQSKVQQLNQTIKNLNLQILNLQADKNKVITQLQAKIQQHQQKINQINQQNSENIAGLQQEKNEGIQLLNAKISQHQAKINETNQQHNQRINSLEDEKNSVIQSLKATIQQQQTMIDDINKQFKKQTQCKKCAQYVNKITELNKNHSDHLQKIKSLQNKQADLINTQVQSLITIKQQEAPQLTSIKESQNLNSQLKFQEVSKGNLQRQRNQIKQQLTLAQKEIKQLQMSKQNYLAELAQLRPENKRLNQQNQSLSEKIKSLQNDLKLKQKNQYYSRKTSGLKQEEKLFNKQKSSQSTIFGVPQNYPAQQQTQHQLNKEILFKESLALKLVKQQTFNHKSDLQKIKLQIVNKQTQIQTKNHKSAQLSANLENAEISLNQKQNLIQSQSQILKNIIRELQQTKATNQNIKKQSQQHSKKLIELKSQLIALQTSINTKKSIKQAIQNQIANELNKLKLINKQIGQNQVYKTISEDFKKNYDGVKEQLILLNEENNSLKKENQVLKVKQANLIKQNKKQQNYIVTVDQNLKVNQKNLQQQKQKSTLQIQILIQKVKKLQQQNQSFNNQIQTLKVKQANLIKQKQKLQNNIANLNQKIKTLQNLSQQKKNRTNEQIKKLTEKVKYLEQQNRNANQKITQQQLTIESLNSQLKNEISRFNQLTKDARNQNMRFIQQLSTLKGKLETQKQNSQRQANKTKKQLKQLQQNKIDLFAQSARQRAVIQQKTTAILQLQNKLEQANKKNVAQFSSNLNYVINKSKSQIQLQKQKVQKTQKQTYQKLIQQCKSETLKIKQNYDKQLSKLTEKLTHVKTLQNHLQNQRDKLKQKQDQIKSHYQLKLQSMKNEQRMIRRALIQYSYPNKTPAQKQAIIKQKQQEQSSNQQNKVVYPNLILLFETITRFQTSLQHSAKQKRSAFQGINDLGVTLTQMEKMNLKQAQKLLSQKSNNGLIDIKKKLRNFIISANTSVDAYFQQYKSKIVEESKQKIDQKQILCGQQLSKYQQDKKSLEKNIKQMQGQINKLKQTQQQNAKQIQNYKNQISRLKQDLASKQRNLTEVSQKIRTNNQLHAKKLNQQKLKYEADIKSLEQNLELDSQQIQQKSAKILNLESSIKQMKTRIMDHQKTISNLKADLQSKSKSGSEVSTQLNQKDRQINTLNKKIQKLQDELKKTTEKLKQAQQNLDSSFSSIKNLQSQNQKLKFQLKTQNKTLSEKIDTLSKANRKLEQQVNQYINLNREISSALTKKLQSREPVLPDKFVSSIINLSPKIGMKLITSTILNGCDKERSAIAAKIQDFMGRNIRRSDIIYKMEGAVKSMAYSIPRQGKSFAFAMIYKTKKGKIFGSFSQDLLKKTFVFFVPLQSQEHKGSNNEIKFILPKAQCQKIESIKFGPRNLHYGNNELELPFTNTTTITANSTPMGQVYFQNIKWGKELNEHKQDEIALVQCELHRVQFQN